MTVKHLVTPRRFFLLVSGVALILAGLCWLAILLLLLNGFHGWLSSTKFIKQAFFAGMLARLLSVCALAILFRLFVLELYIVPSGSMEDSIFTGDKIIVNKLNYGPKLPRSPLEIPWINLLFYNRKHKPGQDSLYWNYARLGGFAAIKRNDVMVFRKAGAETSFLVKRCMALPGETISINDGNILIDGKPLQLGTTVKQHYSVQLRNSDLFIKIADSLHIDYANRVESGYPLSECYLNFRELAYLKSIGCIGAPKYLPLYYGAFPQQPAINWTLDDFGGLKVPARGMNIDLNERNFLLYRTAIELDGAEIEERDRVFFINKIKASHYAFRSNYYFVLGDNRSNSVDSRFWGFVPESAIEGKVIFSFFSTSKTGDLTFLKWL